VIKLSISNKIKGMMSSKGKKSYELAEYFGISAPAMRNKMTRGSFSAEDLIKFADYLGYELTFISDNQKTVLDLNDITEGEE
jgi:transcriptional regulator with XRE-family HTH domain